MRRLVILLIEFAVLTSMSFLQIKMSQAQANYQYGYILQFASGDKQFAIIDPFAPNNQVKVIPLALAKELRIDDANISTDGRWISLEVHTSDRKRALTILDARSGEIRNQFDALYIAQAESTLALDQPSLLWAANGQYLSFIAVSDTNIAPTVFLYSVNTSQVSTVSPVGGQPVAVAWNRHSPQLAIASTNCSNGCSASFEIYNPADKTSRSLVTISGGDLGVTLDSPAAICYLDWSPNGRYISFMAGCDALNYSDKKEMYLIDVTQSSLHRITDFTFHQNLLEQNGFLWADYRPSWSNTGTLVISTVYGAGENRRSETWEYTPNTGVLNKLSDEFIQTWAENPILQTTAFQSLGSDPAAYDGLTRTEPIIVVPPNANLGHALQTGRQQVTANTPNGCNLSWSPDGKILAYTLSSGNNSCRSNVQGFGFVDAANGQVTSVVPSLPDTDSAHVIPIGWVQR